MEPSEDAAFISAGLRHTDINFVLASTNIRVSTLRVLRSAGIIDALTLRECVADGSLPPDVPPAEASALRGWVRQREAGLSDELATLNDPERASASILDALAGADRMAAERLLPPLTTAEVREAAAVRLRLYSHGSARYNSAARFGALYLRLCERSETETQGLFGPTPARGNIAAPAAFRLRLRRAAEPGVPGSPAPEVIGVLRDVRNRAAVYKPGAWRSPPLPLLALATRVLLSLPEAGLPKECSEDWTALMTEFGVHAGG